MQYVRPRNIRSSYKTIVQKSIINGGAAGAHTVSGILLNDRLVCVWEQDGASGLLTDLSSEFTITADDTIDNTGGTATAGDTLIVEWQTATV